MVTSTPRIMLPAEPLVHGPTALRPWREDDIDALPALVHDSEIVRWIGLSAAYDREDARAYLAARRDWARAGLGASFAVIDAGDGVLLGSISLMRIVWRHRRAELGYWLGALGRGAGHATRSVGLITQWGFRSLGLERIELFADTGNPASQAVAERAGFTREAVLRDYLSDGEDFVCFGLLSTDRRR